MHVVIEISSYDKEWITNGYYIPEEINIRISEAIAKGTPLPKGHGRLIDADELKKIIQENDVLNMTGFNVRFCDINNTPTIIEADTEREGY